MRDWHKSPNLDFLRACAVLTVYIGHLLQTFRVTTLFGRVSIFDIAQTGVIIFFVHTSLVLMLSMERLGEHTSFFRAFYIRRAFRIYPLSILIVALMLVLRIPGFPTWLFTMPDGETLAANLTLSQNLLRTESYPAVLWSLPFEVQMYLALPLLFLLVRGASWYRPFAFWVVSVAALVVLRLTGLTLLTDLFSYVPCFLAGIMAYRLTDRQAHVLPFIGWPVSIVACVGIRVVAEVSGLYAPTKWSPWLACLWLAVSLPLFRELSWVPLKTAAHLIAKFSYGIYLSHLAVFWFAFFWIQDAGMATRVLICIGLSVTIPIILYYAIEQPLIRAGIRLTTIKRVAVRTAEAHQRLAFTKSESTSVTSYFPAQR